MLNKLTFAEQRYIQIEGEMNDPEIAANPTEFTKRIKEYNSLPRSPRRISSRPTPRSSASRAR